jgi:hypothetical protein
MISPFDAKIYGYLVRSGTNKDSTPASFDVPILNVASILVVDDLYGKLTATVEKPAG